MSYNDVSKYISKKLKQLRLKNNISQRKVAEALGTSQQTIARYEKGERKPDQNILFALAEYFHVSINDFFPEQEDKNNDEVLEMLFQVNKDLNMPIEIVESIYYYLYETNELNHNIVENNIRNWIIKQANIFVHKKR